MHYIDLGVLSAKWGFHGGSHRKESACNVGDLGSICGSGRSPGEGNGYPLQYSCLGNVMDRGVWPATVHGTAKESDTTQQLNNKNSSWFIPSCQFQVYSKVIQLYINICPLFFRFFAHIGYYRLLSRVPVLYSRSMLIIYFTYCSVFMLIPNS